MVAIFFKKYCNHREAECRINITTIFQYATWILYLFYLVRRRDICISSSSCKLHFSVQDTEQNYIQQSPHGTTNSNCTETFQWPFSDNILFGSEEDNNFKIQMRKDKSMSKNLQFCFEKDKYYFLFLTVLMGQ